MWNLKSDIPHQIRQDITSDSFELGKHDIEIVIVSLIVDVFLHDLYEFLDG